MRFMVQPDVCYVFVMKMFTWLWNEKNVCVGEQRDPTCCETVCMCSRGPYTACHSLTL